VASDLGTIEKGKLADLVITDGDPARDLAVLREPWAVLKDGQVVAGTAAAGLLAP
jgi:imidazolonepropionase-like amidohydrolase